MDMNSIKSKLNTLQIPSSGYRIFSIGEQHCYLGRSSNGSIVFVIDSTNSKLKSIAQTTKHLAFYFNQSFLFHSDTGEEKKVVHMLVGNHLTTNQENAFIRLTRAFAMNNAFDDQFYLIKLFSALKALFEKERKSNEMELQGLFAELYAMHKLHEYGCDIAEFWQSKDRMKFDFSLDRYKRIEIKSTLKPIRIHHFLHEQLLSDLYDIVVISIMLQKNDCGCSLKQLIDDTYLENPTNVQLLLHIEQLTNRFDDAELSEYKYDLTYCNDRFGLYFAKDIPHFVEQNPDGVANTEYDCNLTGITQLPLTNFISWMAEKRTE